MTDEIWRDAIGYEGIYKVSSKGNIKNSRGMLMKSFDSGYQYRAIKLTKDGDRRHKKIHRLVAESFISADIGCLEVNHINGIRDDNRVENLEWVTSSQNVKHAYSHLGKVSWARGKTGAKSHLSKAVYSVSLDDGSVQSFDYIGEAAKLGFERSAITRCCKGKAKAHKGRLWFYSEANGK